MRIRWYGRTGNHQDMVPVFMELKSREGFASSKQRQGLLVPAEHLKLAYLSTGIVDRTTFVNTLAGFGHYPEIPLRPVIMISYWRYRFNEMLTGTRVSLDYSIRSWVVTPELGHRGRELRLQGGVIEVKGSTLELPLTIRRLRLLDTDWSRFSKYGYCIESHLTPPGTAGQLWPSGRMVEP